MPSGAVPSAGSPGDAEGRHRGGVGRSLTLAVAALLLAAASALADRRAAGSRRVRRLQRAAGTPRAVEASADHGHVGLAPSVLAPTWVGIGGIVGIGGGVVGGGDTGLLAGAALTAVGAVVSRRAASSSPRENVTDVVLAVDLLAVALAAGAPLSRALQLVGQAVGGGTGAALARAATSLRLGADPGAALGEALVAPELAPLRRTLVRTCESGTSAAAVLTALAADLRSRRETAAEQRAARAEVLAVLPLGLCFLPAFVLLGLVPVVAGFAREVLDLTP